MTNTEHLRFRSWLEELHHLGDHSRYPLALCCPSGRMLFANRASRTLMHIPPDAGPGTPMDDWLASIGPLDRRAILSPTDPVALDVSIDGEAFTLLTDPIVGGAETRLWLVATLPAAVDVDRERLGFAGVRAGLERLTVGLDGAELPMLVTDANGRLGFVNVEAREALGAATIGVAGQPLSSLFRRTSKPEVTLAELSPADGEIVGEWGEVSGRGRRSLTLELSGAVARDDGGAVIGCVWLGRQVASAAKPRAAKRPMPGTAPTTAVRALCESVVAEFFPQEDRLATFKRGHSLFREGELVKDVYIVLDGQVRLHLRGGGAHSRTIGHAYHGLVGAFSPHEAAPRHRYSAEVTKAAKVVTLDWEEVAHMRDAGLADRVVDLIRDQHVRLLARLDILLQTSHRRRLARLLVHYAENARLDDGGLMLPRVSQVDLAEQIGATRKTVADCLKEFAKDDMVRFGERTILVLDLQALRKL